MLKSSKWDKMKRWIPLYLMFLPGAIYLIINNYIPMGGLIVAFKNYNVRKGIFGSSWSGLKNFEFLFKSPDAWVITRNTLLYNLAFIVVNNVLGILFAIFICDAVNKHLKKIYQSAILFPFLMSTVVVGYLVYAFLSTGNGLINKSILEPLGKQAISWYQDPTYWPLIIIFVNTWKGVGYGCLIYISSINGIDPTYYEAAELDGASKWQQIKNITLPSVLPTTVTLVLMSVGKIFYSDFGLFYQVPRNSGLLYRATDVIDTYVYRALMVQTNIGMSSAAGFYQSICGFVLVLVVNMIVRKIDKEQALF